jgi:hypothetical protein
MEKMERLREIIRKEIVNEISTTGGVAGYLTPNAFVGDKHDNKKHMDSLVKRIGYTITSRGKSDLKKGDTLSENYYQYRNDTTKLPHQKIGNAISELNRQLKLIERALRMNSRLKKEYGVSNEKLWKRTMNQMTKLEGKLVELAGRLREMRG